MNWQSVYERLRLLVDYDRWPASVRREEYENRTLKFEIRGSENQVLSTGTFVEWEFNYPPENWTEDNSRAGVPLMNWFVSLSCTRFC